MTFKNTDSKEFYIPPIEKKNNLNPLKQKIADKFGKILFHTKIACTGRPPLGS